MVLLLAVLALLPSVLAENRVAVVDTGLDIQDPRVAPFLCKEGHRDFTGKGLRDTSGHGTHIVGRIIAEAQNADYCILVLKYFDKYDDDVNTQRTSLRAMIEALTDPSVVMINYSGGGVDYNPIEKRLLETRKDVTLVAAAGNSGKDLATIDYYPAEYELPNVIVVGNGTKGKRHDTSNYGIKVNDWIDGQDIKSLSHIYPLEAHMSGSSMSAAIKTGRLIYERFKKP